MGLRAVLVVLLVSGIFSEGEAGKSPTSSGVSNGATVTPESVLVESYQVGLELIPSERAILLSFLSRLAAEYHLKYARPWAEENFRLAQQLPMTWNRVAIEKNAVVALSYGDPRRAINLLRIVDLPVADAAGSFPEDVRADSAKIIFANYWLFAKHAGLANIRSTASYLGQTGQYPYRAVTKIVTDVAISKKQPHQLSDDARTLILDAYASYGRGSKFESEDAEFVEFLQALRSILPPPLFRQGLELAVERLLKGASTTSTMSYVANVHTDKGTATFRSVEDKLLFDLLPTIREVDPAWAKQIVQRDPALAQINGDAGRVASSEGVFSTAGSADQQDYGLQQSRAYAAGDLAKSNPREALEMAQTISNPALRTVALANIANVIGKSDPGQALDIEKNIGGTIPAIRDSQDRLLASASLARTAASARDMTTFRANVEKCFVLGEELFEEDLIAHPGRPTYDAPAYHVLNDLVNYSVPVDPSIVTAAVDGIQNNALKAFLLQDLAAGLYKDNKSDDRPKVHSSPKAKD